LVRFTGLNASATNRFTIFALNEVTLLAAESHGALRGLL
jgi:hypothetical protein